MKVKLHIPTKEYAFIEVEVDDDLSNIHQLYDEIVHTFEPKEGLGVNEWAKVRNHYHKTGKIEVEEYEALSNKQKYFINEDKLAHRAK